MPARIGVECIVEERSGKTQLRSMAVERQTRNPFPFRAKNEKRKEFTRAFTRKMITDEPFWRNDKHLCFPSLSIICHDDRT